LFLVRFLGGGQMMANTEQSREWREYRRHTFLSGEGLCPNSGKLVEFEDIDFARSQGEKGAYCGECDQFVRTAKAE
jgi:hypothetical protein